MKEKKRILIHNIGKIVLCGESFEKPLSGEDMKNAPFIDNGYVLIAEDRIQDYGPMSACPELNSEMQGIDANGGMLLPSWVDSHTHIVFHSSREKEFVARIEGKSYVEIAAAGGGILNSAKRLAEASEEELFDQAWARLKEVIGFGTGAIEIKSGYGLSVETELKMLRVIQQLKEKSPIPVKATFLGAHAIPQKYKSNRAAYIQLIIEEMLPKIAEEGLADYIDVFCDKGFFTVDETRQLLTAGKKYGLKAKIHANELAISGGVQIGVEMDALSVDHLEAIGQAEIDCLLNSNTLPVVLPGTSFFLNIDYAPARKIIDAGLPLVIATDYNPGSTPSGNMPLTLSLACTQMKLLPIEAIVAATINAAFAIEMEAELGSISKGKRANLILTKPMNSLDYMFYAYGSQHIERCFIGA